MYIYYNNYQKYKSLLANISRVDRKIIEYSRILESDHGKKKMEKASKNEDLQLEKWHEMARKIIIIA